MRSDRAVLLLREHYESQQWVSLLEVASGMPSTELEANAELLFFVASAHRYLAQPELGLSAYQQALLLDPGSIGLRLEVASALQELEDWSAAQHLLEGVGGDQSHQSVLAEILRLRNSIYLGDPQVVEQQLLSTPISHESHLLAMGIALAEVNLCLGRHDIAQHCLDQLFEHSPDSPRGLILQLRLISLNWHSGGTSKKIEALLDRSNSNRLVGIEAAKTYERFKLLEEAKSLYQALIDHYGLHGQLADAYMQYLANHGLLSELKAAIDSHPECIDFPFPLWLAQCCLEVGMLDEAAVHLQECPSDDRKLLLMTRFCSQSGDVSGALLALNDLHQRYPANPNIEFDLSLALLKSGDWLSAWRHYEQRFQIANSSYCVPAGIRPVHSNLHPKERHVLVFGEQGIGDTVMMASVLPDLFQVAESAVLFVQPRLADLFSHSFPDLEVVSSISEQDFLRYDSCYGMGSLPAFFRPSTASCPGTPYLSVDSDSVSAWRRKLAQRGCGLNIGLTWRGGAPGLNGQRRSMRLEQLLPLLKIDGLNLFSLQNRHDPSELQHLRDQHGVVVTHFPGIADDIYQTAALISALDLVVTVQQSALHLAGALGQQAWVLLPANAEWRYGSQGSDMPWYSSVELFRQSSLGDWSAPIELVRQRLIRWRAEVGGQNEEH